MSQIFISYSRKDLAIAEKIIDALAKDDLEPWIDWKSIPKGETFEIEIQQGIEKAEIFLFLVSPDSVQSGWCNKEIAHAVKNGKRILPIVIRDTDLKTVHPEISKRNWIFCRVGQDDFNKAIKETYKTIHADYEWLKYHTELQVKAMKWEQKKDASRLLRGKELREAEQQLAEVSTSNDPQPTKIQREYLLASQRNENLVRRQFIAGLGVGLFIMLTLTILAWEQRKEVLLQKATAEANEADIRLKTRASRAIDLATLAKNHEQTPMASLLSIEAFNIYDTHQTIDVMLGLLQSSHLKQTIYGISNRAPAIAFNPNEKVMAIGKSGGNGGYYSIDIVDTTSGQIIQNFWGTDRYAIQRLAFTMNGKQLTKVNLDGTIEIWDLASSQILQDVEKDWTFLMDDVIIDLNGKAIALSNMDGNIAIHDLIGGQSFDLSTDYSPDSPSPVISPDGNIVAMEKLTSVNDVIHSIVLLVNTQDGELIQELNGYLGEIKEFYFSPDGVFFAAELSDSDENWSIYIWDLRTGQIIQTLSGYSGSVTYMAFAPNSEMLAVNSCGEARNTTCQITIFEVAIGKPVMTFVGHNSAITDMVFSNDGKILATMDCEYSEFRCVRGRTMLWDLTDTQSIVTPLCDEINSAQIGEFLPNSDILFLTNYFSKGEFYGDKIMKCDIASGQLIDTPLKNEASTISSLAFSEDGKNIAVGKENGDVLIYDLDSQEISKSLPSHTHPVGPISRLAFSPNGKVLISEGCTSNIDFIDCSVKEIILWDIAGEAIIGQVLHTNYALINGDLLANVDCARYDFGSCYQRISFLDINTGQLIQELDGPLGTIGSMVLSPDNRFLASANDDGTVFLWDLSSTGKAFQKLTEIKFVIPEMAFSSDGNILMISNVAEIELWDVPSRVLLRTLRSNSTGTVTNSTFGIDNRIIVSTAEDNSIIVWDAMTGRSIGYAVDIHDGVLKLDFSPSGKFIMARSERSIEILNLEPEFWKTRLCLMAGRNFTQTEWTQYFPGEEYRLTCVQWPAGE